MNYEVDFRNENGSNFKRLVWSTDLHLDAIGKAQYRQYFDLLAAYEPDIVLIGGDISNGVASFNHLTQLAKVINKTIYFVLGNHDFYYGSIAKIRELAQKFSQEYPHIVYLTDNKIIPLSEQTALIGHDGWSDARAGNFFESEIMLNDYFLIDELKNATIEERQLKLHQLGDEAALFLKKQLIKAFKIYQRVVLLTHVPPFEEACAYQGEVGDPNWTPHFVSKVTGEVIEQVMKDHPEKQLLILCGHAHWGNDVEILPNLRVVTGHSELGNPNVQGLIFVN
jgi:predicted phosphohydrolase